MGSKIPRFQVTYYDENREPDVVPIGQWEVALAERKYGVGCMNEGNVEAIIYSAYLGAQRCQLTSGAAFEAWGQGVASIEPMESGESPAPLDA